MRSIVDKCDFFTYNTYEVMAMLVRFSVKNYKSFKDLTTFSMVAGKHTRHKNHVFIAEDKRLLKGSVIYGANASGKTNLIRAIQFGRNVALKGLKEINISDLFYRIDKRSFSKPGIFQYDFYSNGNFYSYGFALSYEKQIIISEWLYIQNDENEICVFERNHGEKMKTTFKFTKQNKHRFEIYGDDVDDKNTFLCDMIRKKVNKESEFKAFFDVGSWLSNLIFIFPQTKLNSNEYYNSLESQFELERLLKYFDTGIERVSGREVEAEKALSFLDERNREEILSDIFELLNTDKKSVVSASIFGKRFSFKMKKEKIYASLLFMNHGNELDLFDFNDESDGTKRLFDLIPLFSKGKTDCVIFVDELDRSFHTKLTIEFIRTFYEKTKNSPSQLIATLHDENVMDLNLLRQDEIWFVERKEHCSRLYPLSEFKERFDKIISKEYIQGRYGAIPYFDPQWIKDE